MRKKTVKFVADTVFWYILYFLPIVSYLLFCFSEPISYLTVADDTVTEPTEIVQVIEETQTEYVIPAGEYEFNETLTSYLGDIGQFVIISANFISASTPFLSMSFDYGSTDYNVMYFDDVDEHHIEIYNFYNNSWMTSDSYRTVDLLSDILLSEENSSFYFWFAENTSFDIPSEPEPEPEQSTLRVVSFTNYITSAFSFLEDNVFYTSLDGAIGANGLCPLISDKGLLLYLSWFVSVYIAHLFVDFVLFIPRLAHKWLNAFTQGD